MKRGFTLIEIMVVIVIMGVLAAVGVPKLFGYIAKAKASEIHAAAGTYIHLQDAYLGNKPGPGTWKDIGYEAPGNGKTDVFCYSNGNLAQAVNVSEIPENTIGWAASNVVGLNDCAPGGWWSVVITPKGASDVNYAHNVNSNLCGMLTSGWNMGTTMSGSCTSASVAQAETEPSAPSTPDVTPTPETEPEPEPEPEKPSTPETPTTPAPSTIDEAIDAIKGAKLAYTSHKGGQSDEEGQRLKKAWEDAVAQCEAAYGKKNCNADGLKKH